jgi:hypothetical protein
LGTILDCRGLRARSRERELGAEPTAEPLLDRSNRPQGVAQLAAPRAVERARIEVVVRLAPALDLVDPGGE